MKCHVVVILAIGLGLFAPGRALASEPYTLADAIERAVARHPVLRVAGAHVLGARARETQAQALPNPTLSFQGNEVPLGQAASGNFMAGVSVPWPWGGGREARVAIARLETAIAELEVEEQRQDLVMRVKLAFVRLLHEHERLGLVQANLAAAQQLLKAAEVRYAAGDVPRTEVFRAQVEQHRAQRELLVAESQRAMARSRLQALVGQEAGVAVVPLPAPTDVQLPSMEALAVRMRAARPELRRVELAIASEAQQHTVAQARLWEGTEVAVAGGAAAGQAAISTSVSMPLRLYRGQGELAEVEARAQLARARREVLLAELALELEEAYRETSVALARYRLVLASDLPQARRFAANAQQRFLVGEGSGMEAVEALRTLRDTAIEQEQALLTYREAAARLERASGASLSQ